MLGRRRLALLAALFLLFTLHFIFSPSPRSNESQQQGSQKEERRERGQKGREQEEPRSPKEIMRTQEGPAPAKKVSLRGHAFYYAWYGNPSFEGKYLHWNHEYLPHWAVHDRNLPTGRHEPPNDIGANYYPELGPYSSSSDDVIQKHMEYLVEAGIGVIAVSWYSPNRADGQGKSPDPLIPKLLDACHRNGLFLTFHLEPYEGRTAESVRDDVIYIVEHYSAHPAYYLHDTPKGKRGIFYIYDSYQVTSNDWSRLFLQKGRLSLRGTSFDSIFIGLVVEKGHLSEILHGGFDGMYTYFASEGFTFGSTKSHWKEIASFCSSKDLFFIPSVGPGYVDTRVRAWNGRNTKERHGGKTYLESFEKAIEVSPEIISITSFNEWHEGTQIEPAIPFQTPDYTYLDYSPSPPDFYLLQTRLSLSKFDPKSFEE